MIDLLTDILNQAIFYGFILVLALGIIVVVAQKIFEYNLEHPRRRKKIHS